jgi:hypothetical protein
MELLIEYIVRNFSVSTDTAATLIITIFVFANGLFAQLIYLYIGNIISRTRKRRIIFSMLNKIIKDSEKMVSSINKHIVNFNNSKGNLFEIDIIPIQFLEEIRKIDIFDFYNSFFIGIENLDRRNIKDKEKKFNKVHVHLNTLNYINSNYLSEFFKYQKSYRDYGDEWNSEVQFLTKSYRKLSLSFESYNSEEKEFVNEFHTIYTTWIKDDNPHDCYIIEEKLLKPSIILLKKTDYYKVPNMDELINILVNCKVINSGKISLIESRKRNLLNNERRLRHSYWSLKKLVKIFNPNFSII